MPRTDLNTLDDWWNEGFDDFFDGAGLSDGPGEDTPRASYKWCDGWRSAQAYRNALKEQTDE